MIEYTRQSGITISPSGYAGGHAAASAITAADFPLFSVLSLLLP